MKKTKTIQKIVKKLSVDEEYALKLLKQVKQGGEVSDNYENWFDQRFDPNCLLVDESGYTKSCIQALNKLSKIMQDNPSNADNYWQLWADMTRGYLGEYAFKLFLQQNWGIAVQLGHELGELDDYVQTDIHAVQTETGAYRPANLNVSIKTSKWNGIWLDIPGDQFNHADVHIFVKVGTGRDHLFAFFKQISVFKDKVRKKGQERGFLSKDESANLFEALPNFAPIPAYICGFVWKNESYQPLPYGGKLGRKHFTIKTWRGPIKLGDLAQIKERKNVSGDVKFSGIGRFSHNKDYLFNTGNLLWQQSDWEKFCRDL